MRKDNANMTRTYKNKIINRSTQIGFYGVARTTARNRNSGLDPLLGKSADSAEYYGLLRIQNNDIALRDHIKTMANFYKREPMVPTGSREEPSSSLLARPPPPSSEHGRMTLGSLLGEPINGKPDYRNESAANGSCDAYQDKIQTNKNMNVKLVNELNDSFREESSNDEPMKESSNILELVSRRRRRITLADTMKANSQLTTHPPTTTTGQQSSLRSEITP